MKKLILSALIAGSLFAENFINLQLTNETIMLEGQYQVSYTQPFYVRGGYLINSDKDNFYYAGIKSEGQVIGVDVPVKFSLFLDGVKTKDNSALPIGVGVSSYLQQVSIPIFIRGEFEFAPKVLSFQEANRFSKGKVEVGVRFIENGEAFIGYRNINFNKNYDSSVYGGIGFAF